ncbi:hypothetical protein H4S02_007063, partial [Coemansia sp. RSA 2611]
MAENIGPAAGRSSTLLLSKANERVLCFHGPLLYETKVVKAELWDGTDPEARARPTLL